MQTSYFGSSNPFVATIVAAALLLTSAFSWPCAYAADIDAALRKANAYIELAKQTERALESWERYASWVNMKSGPTGKERYISYGMYELSDAESETKEVRELIGTPPQAPELDQAIISYLDAYNALAPVMSQANTYYEAKGYESDNAAEGQKLHKLMVPLATAFIAERDKMMSLLRTFVREVEGQEVAAREKAEGTSARWHVANTMHAANRVVDLFPHTRPQEMNSEALEAELNALGPGTPPEKFDQIIAGATAPPALAIDVTKYGAAVDQYEKAVSSIEAYSGDKPEDFDDFDSFRKLSRQLLAALREFQDPLTKSGGKDLTGGGQLGGEIVRLYFEVFNTAGSMWGTQLRYLP